jgi:hypothetical protein
MLKWRNCWYVVRTRRQISTCRRNVLSFSIFWADSESTWRHSPQEQHRNFTAVRISNLTKRRDTQHITLPAALWVWHFSWSWWTRMGLYSLFLWSTLVFLLLSLLYTSINPVEILRIFWWLLRLRGTDILLSLSIWPTIVVGDWMILLSDTS